MIKFIFSTGCRIGEIVSLEKIALIGQTGQLFSEGKEIKKGKFFLISAVKFGPNDTMITVQIRILLFLSQNAIPIE